jgi:hypothetical protein
MQAEMISKKKKEKEKNDRITSIRTFPYLVGSLSLFFIFFQMGGAELCQMGCQM